MVKHLLKLFICTFVMSVPLVGMAQTESPAHTQLQETAESVKLTVSGKTVRVQHGRGQVLEVYSVTGAKVLSLRIETADQSVRLNLNRGCYILKISDVARKVSLL